MIGAVSILSGCIEIIGFIKDRSAKKELLPISNQIDLSSGPHTNVSGDQENLFSGTFDGPTSAKGDAVDMRESTGSINVAEGPVNQHFGNNITQIIKPPEKQLIPRIQPPPHNFVGRVDNINEILCGFERGAVIAGLRGMGGVGKTALALKLAEKLASRYPDGQILVEMKGTAKEPLSWAESMIQIIHAYDPGYKMPPNEGELRGKYFSILHGKKALLFLDNAASREQVEPLLPPPESALLLTSRYKFALPGLLKEMDLDPGVLPQEDAEMLLLNICGRIGDHADKLAKLCGCLPIALRNAAYALKEKPNLSPDGYIERLGDAKMRLQLVDASFSTSYDLLTPELQKLWSMLSVFPADFDLAGAAAVWEMEEMPAEDTLGELVKWSLVDFLSFATSEGGRYRLHDLARDFADTLLNEAESESAKLRHAEHYMGVLALADEIFQQGKNGTLKGLQLFDQERANILIGQSWAEKSLEKESSSATDLCKSYPYLGSHILDLRLSPREIIPWLNTALQASRLSNDKKREASFLCNLGVANFDLAEFRKAIEFYEQALQILQEIEEKWIDGHLLCNLGNAYLELGDVIKGIEFYNQALAKSRELGNRRGEGRNLGNLGNAYVDLGEPRKAIEFNELALQISIETGDRKGEGNRLGCLGNAYIQLGEYRKAIDFYDQTLKIKHEIGDRRGEETTMGNLGLAYYRLGEPQKAIEFYEQALKIAQKIEDRMGEGNHLFNMSLSLHALGQKEESISFAKSALAIFEQIESPQAETVRQKLAEWSA